jgi:hypothetical protein
MIGVDDQALTLGGSPSQYKRDILFYDCILLMHSNVALDEWRYGSHSKPKYHAFADEMEYILDAPYFAPASRLAGVPISGPAVDDLGAALRELDQLLQKALPRDAGLTVPFEEFMRLQGLRASLSTRLAAASLTNHGTAAVSAHKMPLVATGAAIPSLGAGDVIRLAIDRVLIPDERTSWEDIFALKQDHDLQDRARKLRLWAVKTARNETSLTIAEEQLADLLSDYEHYLRAHRLKYSTMTLGAVITEGAELIEDVLKLRLGKVARRFFSVTKTKADMTLSEMKAPGRELSIVTQLNDRLV